MGEEIEGALHLQQGSLTHERATLCAGPGFTASFLPFTVGAKAA